MLRRRFLQLGLGTLAGLAASAPFGADHVLQRRIREAIADVFGDDVARSDATFEFASAHIAALQRDVGGNAALRLARITVATLSGHGNFSGPVFRAQLVDKFLRSTTVVAHHEADQPLEFTGYFDPYRLPCGNQLSAAYQPDD